MDVNAENLKTIVDQGKEMARQGHFDAASILKTVKDFDRRSVAVEFWNHLNYQSIISSLVYGSSEGADHLFSLTKMIDFPTCLMTHFSCSDLMPWSSLWLTAAASWRIRTAGISTTLMLTMNCSGSKTACLRQPPVIMARISPMLRTWTKNIRYGRVRLQCNLMIHIWSISSGNALRCVTGDVIDNVNFGSGNGQVPLPEAMITKICDGTWHQELIIMFRKFIVFIILSLLNHDNFQFRILKFVFDDKYVHVQSVI